MFLLKQDLTNAGITEEEDMVSVKIIVDFFVEIGLKIININIISDYVLLNNFLLISSRKCFMSE